MNNISNKIEELKIEEILQLIFIFLAALNIYGDKLEELFVLNNDNQSEQRAKSLFTFTVSISLIIYFYFAYRNYKYAKSASKDEKKVSSIRFLGSIFIIVGTICILYYDIKDQDPIGSPTI